MKQQGHLIQSTFNLSKAVVKKLLLVSFVGLVWIPGFSQSSSYISVNNNTGAWENASTWTKEFAWMTNPPPPTTNLNQGIRNYGYVTRNGNLSTSGGDGVIHVYDTLVIDGNLSMSSGGTSAITVYNGGLLVVLGNFMATNNSTSLITANAGGRVVIMGNYQQLQGSVTSTGDFYIFDETPQFNWGSSVDGTAYNGSNSGTMGDLLDDEDDLIANDMPLYQFLASLGAVTLPITLISFEATAHPQYVILDWSTAMEKNSEKFIIQRSGDGLNYREIGTLPSSGNSDIVRRYTFSDNNPLSGKNYYRLKSLDFDGTYEYSKLVMAEWKGNGDDFTVYPNPVVAQSFTIQSNEDFENPVKMELVSSTGRMIYHAELTAMNTVVDLPENVEPGMYIVKLIAAGEQKTIRIAVK